MISAFGVEHTFSKSDPLQRQSKKVSRKIDSVVDENGKMSDSIAPIAPGSTVDVYNNSRANKKQVAVENWGAKIAAGAAGTAAGYGAYRLLRGKTKMLKTASKYGKKKKQVSAEKKQGLALAGLTTVGSSVGGYAGSRAHQEYVKKNPKYRYQEK